MASTCLALIKNAMIAIGAIDMRKTPTAHDADYCMGKLQDLILSLPHFNSNWNEVEVNTDYTAGFNERIAVIGDVTVTITLPQMVESDRFQLASLPGFIMQTGVYYSAPRDGSRVLTYAQQGTDTAFYAYRADTGHWVTVTGLTLTDELPINADLHGYLEAMLAVDISGAYGGGLTEGTIKKASEAEAAFTQRFLYVPESKIDDGLQTSRWGSWV